MNLTFFNTIHLLTKTYDQVRKSIQNKHQLMGAEVDVLLFLANNPEHSRAQDIVEVRKLTKSHASLAIKSLEEKGYLIKQQNIDNKKEYHLSLTSKVESILVDAQTQQNHFLRSIFKNIDSKQLNELNTIFTQIQKNLLEIETVHDQ